jgi:transposase InsO family protein
VLQEKIGHLLKRPAGRPPQEVCRYYSSFSYRAGSWTKPRRVVAKVEWHPGELYPRVGFVVTNLARPAERVVAFYKRTTDSQQAWPVAPNLLDQDFTGTRPDEKWGADISYVWTREGCLYLAVVIDLFARRVVGWATGDRLHRDLALAALRKALAMRRPAAGLIHHSDRGSQGAAEAYRHVLARSGITPSMSHKGDCLDNAPMESFFHTLKTERVHHRIYYTRTEARRDLFQYIEGFYNSRRLHSALGYLSPALAEQLAA